MSKPFKNVEEIYEFFDFMENSGLELMPEQLYLKAGEMALLLEEKERVKHAQICAEAESL